MKSIHLKTYMIMSILCLSLMITLQACGDDDINTNNTDIDKEVSEALNNACLDWGKTPTEVAQYMKGYSTIYENYADIDIYKDSKNDKVISYQFKNNRLCATSVMIASESEDVDLIKSLKGYEYFGNLEEADVYINSKSNIVATSWGNSDGFFTIGFTPITSTDFDAVEPYSVITGGVENIRPFRATATGTLLGAENECEVGFYLGTDPTMSECRKSASQIVSRGDFSIELTGILDLETYYYQAYAIINDVEYLGEIYSFESSDITYIQNGKEYKFIKVEGGPYGDFSIMQTELDPNSIMYLDDYIFEDEILNFENKQGISKYEIKKFIGTLYQNTGLIFRIPTSQEWILAASGGNKSKNYKYSGSNDLNEVAWYKENSNGELHTFASKQPNELGLYDMSGNYSEVINDYQISYLKDNKITHDNYPISSINFDNVYGGNWSSPSSECTINSNYDAGGARNNIVDVKTVTVRLIYDRKP